MKKVIFFLFVLFMLFPLCGCQGNLNYVDVQDAIEIPEDGFIKESTIWKIKEDNAIATFYGESNGYKYEWIIFGSDIANPQEVNLLIDVRKNPEVGLSVSCTQQGAFGFPALLSIHTGEKWNALRATAYHQTQAMSSVSVTGNKESILNLSLTVGITDWIIRPDIASMEALSPEDTSVAGTDTPTAATKKAENADYLSSVPDEDHHVYSANKGKGQDKHRTDSKDTIASKTDVTNSNTEKGKKENYLSSVPDGDNRVYSDGKATGQDKYLTDPIPEGKPMPVEPEDQKIDEKKSYTCTFSIECSTILNNLQDLATDKLEMVPSDGVIFATATVTFYEGESVYDVLQRLCRENGIHMEASWTPIYNSAYVEGINNLYEFDCGNESGWMYRVNGWYPNYGCSRYQLAAGDIVEWRYTCKGLGKDVGCDWMG